MIIITITILKIITMVVTILIITNLGWSKNYLK